MQSRLFNGFGLALTWLVVSILVFTAIDTYATREVPLPVEYFRGPGMTDEEAVAAAVGEAFRIERNLWWIHNKQPFLVFDTVRTYHFDPAQYETFDLHITDTHAYGTVGLIKLGE